MSMKEMLLEQYNYGCWAREKLLHEARRLSDHQFHTQSEFGNMGSVHSLLLHTLATDWLWRNLSEDGELSGPPPDAEDFATLSAIEAGWQQEEAAFRSFMISLDESELDETVRTVDPAGNPHAFVRWEMVQHMLLHAMQHRCETAAVLTSLGHSPGNLDYLFYMIARG
jgi:uncharacterized damage-inducible protein DinB